MSKDDKVEVVDEGNGAGIAAVLSEIEYLARRHGRSMNSHLGGLDRKAVEAELAKAREHAVVKARTSGPPWVYCPGTRSSTWDDID